MMTGCTSTYLSEPARECATRVVHPSWIAWSRRHPTVRDDILNATFTLFPEYENGRSAAPAAMGRPVDAVENFDAFTELRKPVRRYR
jgi:hypothetical protein